MKQEQIDFLKDKLGDYMSAKDFRKHNLKLNELNTWREQGKLQTVFLGGVWYYSMKSVRGAIQGENK